MAGKFPIIRTERTIPGRGPSVRADIDVKTGEEAIGQAVASLGEAVFKLGRDEYTRQGKAQSDTAERDARLSMLQFVTEVRTEDDVSKWEGLFRKHKDRVSRLIPKNRAGQTKYNSFVKEVTPFWEQMYIELREGKLEDNMLAASIAKVDVLQKAASIDTMDAVTKKIKAELRLRDKLSFSTTREETEALLTKVGRDVQVSAAERMALSDPNSILARVKGDTIEGFDAITDAKDVTRIRNMARTTIGLTDARAKEAKRVMINAEQGRLMDLAHNGQLTIDIIRNSALDEFGLGSKDTFYKILDATAKAVTDWTLYSKLDEEVTNFQTGALDKDAVLDHILDAASKGKLCPPEFKQLVTNLNAEVAKENTYWLKEARSYMEEQVREKDPITGLFTDDAAEIALAAQSKMALDKALETAAREGKPVTGRDILIKAHDIAMPLRTEAAKLRKRKAAPKVIGKGLEETPASVITDEAIDEAERQARENLGEGASTEELKAEMLRILGE